MKSTDAFVIVATPDAEPEHRESVVLVAVHGSEGSLGFVINRPSACSLVETLPTVGVSQLADDSVARHAWRGGATRPDVGWLLFDTRAGGASPEDSCLLTGEIGITASPSAMEEVLHTEGGSAILLLGHVTWEPGALEEELASGRWVRALASARLVFETPSDLRWSDAMCDALGLPRPWFGEARFLTA